MKSLIKADVTQKYIEFYNKMYPLANADDLTLGDLFEEARKLYSFLIFGPSGPTEEYLSQEVVLFRGTIDDVLIVALLELILSYKKLMEYDPEAQLENLSKQAGHRLVLLLHIIKDKYID